MYRRTSNNVKKGNEENKEDTGNTINNESSEGEGDHNCGDNCQMLICLTDASQTWDLLDWLS